VPWQNDSIHLRQFISKIIVCSRNIDKAMTNDDKPLAEQLTGNDGLIIPDQAADKILLEGESSLSNLAHKVGEMERKLVNQSARLPMEMKTLASNALDYAKHPSRYAQLGASLAEGLAGQSLGGALGASVGTVFGPGGTVIGAELGSIVGEVLGARHGRKIAKKFVLQPEIKHPLKEDLQKEGTGKVGGHAGKMIGGLIGDALFDQAGSDIGEVIGDKIGYLAGNIAFKHRGATPIKTTIEPSSEDAPHLKSDDA
jgi:hypothetical protein